MRRPRCAPSVLAQAACATTSPRSRSSSPNSNSSEKPSDYLERTYATDAANILDKLFEGGAITMDQVKDAILAVNEEFDAKRKSEAPEAL